MCYRYKRVVADILIEKFSPIRQEIIKLMNSQEYLNQILKEGQQKANLIASETWDEVALKIGTIPKNIIEKKLIQNRN